MFLVCCGDLLYLEILPFILSLRLSYSLTLLLYRDGAGDTSTHITTSGSGSIRGPVSRLADWSLAAVQHTHKEELLASERTILLQAAVRSDVVPLRCDWRRVVQHEANGRHGSRPTRHGNHTVAFIHILWPVSTQA